MIGQNIYKMEVIIGVGIDVGSSSCKPGFIGYEAPRNDFPLYQF